MRSVGPISSGRYTWYAVVKNTDATPANSPTASRCATVSTSSAAASGTLANAPAETRLHASMTARRGSRPTQTPTGRPNTSQGNHTDAVGRPMVKAPTSSSTIPTSGSATVVMLPPNLLTVSPNHSSRKSRWANSPTGKPAAPGPRSRRRGDGVGEHQHGLPWLPVVRD